MALPDDTIPPPVQSSAFVVVRPLKPPPKPPNPPAVDLSATDGRTVVSLVCAALGFVGAPFCFPIAMLLPVAGCILAIFARPSLLRIIALAGNALVFALAALFLAYAYWDLPGI